MLEPESPPGNYPSAAPSLKGIQPTQNLLLVCDSQQEEGGGERMIGETLAPTQLQVYEEDREEGLPQGSQPQHDPTLDEPNQQRKETSDSCENYEEEIKRLEEETRARWLGPPKPSIASMSQALAKSLVGSQTSMTQLGSLADDDVDAVRIGNDLTEAMAQGSYEAALKMQILSNIMDAVLDSLFGDAAANIDSDRHSLWYWFLIKQLTRSTSNGGSTSIPTMRNLFEDVVWPEERENENAAMAENADAPSCDNHGEQTHVCTAKDDQHGSGKGTCPKVHTEEGGVEGNSAGQDPEDPEGREDMGDEDMEVGGEHILSAIEVSQRQEEIQASLMEVDRMEEEQPQPQPQDQDLAQEEDEEDNEMSNLGRVLSAAAWLVGSWGPRGSPAMPQEPMQGMNEGFTNVHETRDTGVDFTLSQGHVGVMRGGPHSVVPETQDECVPPTEDTLPEAAQNMVHVTDLSSFSQSHSQSKQPQSQSQPSIDVGAVLKAIDGVLAPLGGSQAEAELLQGTTLNAPQNITSLPASTPTLQMNKASNKESKRSRNAFARRQLVARVMGPANLGRQDLGRTVKPPSRLGFDLPLVTRRRSVTPLTNVPRQDPYEFVDQRDQQPEGNTPAPTPTPKAATRTRQAVQRAKTNVLLTSSKRDDKESGKRGIKVGSKEEGKKPASPVVSVRKNQNRAVGRPQKRKLEENNKSAEKRKSARTNNKQNPAASQRQGITSKKTESQGKDRSSTKGGSRKGSCCPKPKPEPKAASQDIFKGINFLISLSENKSSKANRRRSSSTTTESGDEVRRMIEMARGVVVDQVPPPVPPPSPYRRRSLTRCHVDSVHALVAHAASRRPKYVYAALNGLPIVSPGWIKQCIQQGRLLPWSTADISPPKFPTTQTGFEGLRILIVSSSKGTEVERKKFFQHAGAAVVDVGKEFSKDNHDCDLLVIDDELPNRSTVERSARVAHVACITKSKALDIMMRKTSPEDLVKAVDLARIKRVAKSNEHVVHRIGPPPPAPLPHPPAPAPAPPPGRASPSPVASPPPPPAQDRLSEQAVEARDGNKGKSDTPAGQLEVEGPLDHPPSEQLPAKFARKYYDTLVLNGNKIPMGSYVELKSTDTEGSRVAKLEALWVDTVVDGGRHYGKFVRFYRPQETAYAFPFRNDPHFVFQSSVKEQLPLSRVERRCTVSFLPDSTAGPASEPYSYVCMYQYDEETETLTTLPK